MKSILEDIKTQNFKQAYLLYGEEAYLKHQYKNKLKNALLPEDDTMNFSRFEGKGTEIPKVIDLAETMPFFADRRVILLENTGFFKNKADALADYMGSLPDYLVLTSWRRKSISGTVCTRRCRSREEQWNLLVRTKRR